MRPIFVGSVYNFCNPDDDIILSKNASFQYTHLWFHAQLAEKILEGFYFLVGREPRRKWKANISFNKIIKHVKRPQSFALLKPGHTNLKL